MASNLLKHKPIFFINQQVYYLNVDSVFKSLATPKFLSFYFYQKHCNHYL